MHFLPFSFSASIIGMILLFGCLWAGILKIEHESGKNSDFLLSNMAFFFIPAGVSIINYFDLLKSNLWQIAVICAVSTFVTFGVTAFSIRLTKKADGKGAVGLLELCKSPFFGVALSIVAFWIGERIHKKDGAEHLQSDYYRNRSDYRRAADFPDSIFVLPGRRSAD